MQQMQMVPLVVMGICIADALANTKLFLRSALWQVPAMSRTFINALCAGFPGAEVSDPWGGGHDAWKVGGKMFASIGAVQNGVSVKTATVETAEMLIAAGIGVRAPYFHRSWVHLPEGTAEDELRHRLNISYRLIREGLPKKLQSALPPEV